MAGRATKVLAWLEERLPLAPLLELARHKTVPVHRYTVLYYFGGMTLFFFIVQVVTGILLMLYYRPSADEAFESVEFIMTTVPFGWLIRSIHSWSANLMVFFAFVHLATVFFMKAYRKPRELTWITGCILLGLAMGFGFSGYLLPWNQLAFFATKVGTDIAGSVPLVGETLLRFLRGGDEVTGGTLSRFYGWHVAILPALTTLLLLLHLLLVQVKGMSVPPSEEAAAQRNRPMRFLPHFALRDLFGWTLALGVLASLAALIPWELGEKADPFVPAYKDIRPEWYFMFMFQTLKLVPGGEVAGMEYEAIPILLFGLAGLVLVLVPFLDRGLERQGKSPGFTVAGIVSLLFIVGMTAWGYTSWLPVGLVVGTLAVVAVLAFATRPPTALGLLLLVLSSSALAAEPGKTTSCLVCHGGTELFEAADVERVVHAFDTDVHGAVGLSCHNCHGGNPDPALADDMGAAMDDTYAANPYRGAPKKAEIPAFCGRCHSDFSYMKRFRPDARVDQESEYKTSRHGERLAQGDEKVATCVDCHGVHGIHRVAEPDSSVYPAQVATTCGRCHGSAEHMAGYTTRDGTPLPIDQKSRWQRSVHAEAMYERGDLSAPTCNDCHGNHGAQPPGVESVALICGRCHGREAELFRASVKNDLLECLSCHGNHSVVRPTIAMLGPLPATPCALCHEGPEAIERDSPEPERRKKSYEATRDTLLASATAEGLENEARFDWLVERASALEQHTVEPPAPGEPRLRRPEFARLFAKFRIGKTTFSYPDPTSGKDVTESVVRCTDCHSEPPAGEEDVGFATSHGFLERQRELTVLTARAERTLLAARRGGVETRAALADLDQAVDAQVGLEVLVHTFSLAPDGQFQKRHGEGVQHARSALSIAQDALAELGARRRGLWVTLVLIGLVLVALAMKIRQLPP